MADPIPKDSTNLGSHETPADVLALAAVENLIHINDESQGIAGTVLKLDNGGATNDAHDSLTA